MDKIPECPVCKSLTLKFAFTPAIQPEFSRSYYLCSDCDLLVSNLDFEGVLGKRASFGYYESLDTENIAAKFERVMALSPERSDNWTRVRRILQTVSDVRTSFGLVLGNKALDIGSGTGVFAARLLKEDPQWSIDCIEPDARACKHISEAVGVKAICGILEDCKDLGKYDLICMNRVLEHLPKPDRTIEFLDANLAIGGLIYIEVPDIVCYDKFGPSASEFGVEHLTIWSPRSLGILLKNSGFIDLVSGRFLEPSGKISAVVFAARVKDLRVMTR